MNFNLCAKNHLGKWWRWGQLKPNQFGKNQATFKLKDLEELVKLHKDQGKEWVNLSLFEPSDVKEVKPGYKGQDSDLAEDLSDSIPF